MQFSYTIYLYMIRPTQCYYSFSAQKNNNNVIKKFVVCVFKYFDISLKSILKINLCTSSHTHTRCNAYMRKFHCLCSKNGIEPYFGNILCKTRLIFIFVKKKCNFQKNFNIKKKLSFFCTTLQVKYM